MNVRFMAYITSRSLDWKRVYRKSIVQSSIPGYFYAHSSVWDMLRARLCLQGLFRFLVTGFHGWVSWFRYLSGCECDCIKWKMAKRLGWCLIEINECVWSIRGKWQVRSSFSIWPSNLSLRNLVSQWIVVTKNKVGSMKRELNGNELQLGFGVKSKFWLDWFLN